MTTKIQSTFFVHFFTSWKSANVLKSRFPENHTLIIIIIITIIIHVSVKRHIAYSFRVFATNIEVA